MKQKGPKEIDIVQMQIDESIANLLSIDSAKIGSIGSGKIFGTKKESANYYTKKLEYTSITKTDCLILEMEHDLFDILVK